MARRQRYLNPHSYNGIRPPATGAKLVHSEQAVGVNHVALWARNRKEVDRFHREFLTARSVPVADEPMEYPQYWPGYYAVFFDDPINGIHWELAWVAESAESAQCFARCGRSTVRSRDSTDARPDLANTAVGVTLQATRRLPRR
ncbi:VOC family protein [Mycolicibacterium goodii]|uniref:VOC family protein n=1 Tax=Mycolicibacterium goodii TaxID=134601 RepID=UPI003556C778